MAPLLTWTQLDEDMEGSECLEYLNILDEDMVRETHRRFKMAGAQCVLTNTVQANRLALQKHGLEDALVDVNRAGMRRAAEVGFEHIVAAVQVTMPEVLGEQLEVLLKERPDAVFLVGEADTHELSAALETIRGLTDIPLFAPAGDSAYVAKADIIYTMGLSVTDTLQELCKIAAHSKTFSLMACPSLDEPEGNNRRQRGLARDRIAEELVDFALDARLFRAQFIGTTAGSPPAYTGAISAAIGGLDVVA